jgi:hypothetical protein
MKKVFKFWYSSLDHHMCTFGGQTNLQTILHLSSSVLKHHWYNSLTSCSYLAKQYIHILYLYLVHQVLYATPTERTLKGSNLVIWEAMREDHLSPFCCLETDEWERLSLGWHNVEGLCFAGRCTVMISMWLHHLSVCSVMMLPLLWLPKK